MKTIKLALGLGLLSGSLSYGQAAPKMVMRDAATHEELSNRLRQAEIQSPMSQFKPAEGPDPSKTNLPKDLIGRSDILCFNGLATLVPKQAIIFVPPQYADRVGMRDGAQLVTWLDFYTANRGWITAQEITIAQAEGKETLPENTTEQITKGGNLVVATCQGGPISKLAPPVAPPAPEPTKPNP